MTFPETIETSGCRLTKAGESPTTYLVTRRFDNIILGLLAPDGDGPGHCWLAYWPANGGDHVGTFRSADGACARLAACWAAENLRCRIANEVRLGVVRD